MKKCELVAVGLNFVGGDAICDGDVLENSGAPSELVLKRRKPQQVLFETMRRPKRLSPHATPRFRWMAPISPGEESPMDKLMAWLERNGEVYRTATRKRDILEQLSEEMERSGIYGLTVDSIRTQLNHLKRRVRLIAEGRRCTSTDANHYYDRLLATLFGEDERAAMRARAAEREAEEEAEQNEPSRRPLLRTSPRTSSRPISPREATQEDAEASNDIDQATEPSQHPGASLQPMNAILDAAEMNRRFDLLFATDSDAARELDTSDTQEDRAANRVVIKPEPMIQNGSRINPFVVGEAENNEDQAAGPGVNAAGARGQRGSSTLDVTEIQRRVQLVCARLELEQRGVAAEIIDRLLPLPDE